MPEESSNKNWRNATLRLICHSPQEAMLARGYGREFLAESYLGYDNPQRDYGAEWTEVSKAKAETMRTVARLTESLGINGEKER